MPSVPGRNDPCPCGSGRKFKQCCLVRQDADDAARVRVRAAEGRVVDAAMAFATDDWGELLLDLAWEQFWNHADVPDDLATTPEFDQMFIPWFVFGFVLEPDPDEDDDDLGDVPRRPIALEWLDATDAVVPDLNRTYAETACRSPLSVFVVEQVTEGRSLDLKDVLTGARFHVIEQGASRTLREADLVFTRVVTVDGISLLLGASPYVIPPRWHTRIIDWRTKVCRKRALTRRELEGFDVAIRDLYFFITDELLNPPPPDLRNTDGDPIELTTLTFEVTIPVDEAFAKLRPLAIIGDEEHSGDVVRDASGAVTSAVLSWVKRGNRKHKSWDNTVLGTLRLEAGRLVAEVNSARRVARVTREIAKRLRGAAVLVDTQVVDLHEALERRAEHPDEGEAPDEIDTPPELQAISDEATRRHWREWVDVRVPVLGHKTPRQAAKSVAGRERLEALLGEFERRAANHQPSTIRVARGGPTRAGDREAHEVSDRGRVAGP